MIIKELNKRINDLNFTKDCFQRAIESIGEGKCANYIQCGSLRLAIELIENEVKRLETHNWQ